MIRHATAADAPALRALYLEHLTQNPPPDPPDVAQFAEKLSVLIVSPGQHILVTEEAGEVIAAVTLILIGNLTHNLRPYGLIENVVTHASHRRQGHASALVAEACRIAQEAGAYKVMLLTGSKQECTLRFYEKCGFNRRDKTGFIRWLA